MSRKSALISVWDKTGVVDFGRGLAELGYELVASGGSARVLAAAGLAVETVESVTGFAEVLGGRVKTLHPAIHAGLLARPTAAHLGELAERGIAPIDVLACNLYPFAATVADRDVDEAMAIEQIDIGGVTLLRAAAKNFERVTVVCDPADYGAVLRLLGGDRANDEKANDNPASGDRASDNQASDNPGSDGQPGDDQASDAATPTPTRRSLALAAFRHTAAYDAAIATWLAGRVEGDAALPATLNLTAERVEILRYGENPHQAAATYRWAGTQPGFEQLQGKALSYNNIADLEAALVMPAEFERPAVAIVKHTNPCGLAVADDNVAAFAKALACDPVSAFGSIIATNRPVELAFVEAVGKLFVEVIVAPAFSDDALAWLQKRKRNCRVLRLLPAGRADQPLAGLFLRSVAGGLLVQTEDDRGGDASAWRVVSKRAPSASELDDLAFAWLACKHVKSNAILIAHDGATVGVGAGQMNRVESVRIAASAAGDRATGAVLASDAFFPFADGVEAAAAAGVTACIQPGGSIRDGEVIAAADRLGLAMVLTAERHFRHA